MKSAAVTFVIVAAGALGIVGMGCKSTEKSPEAKFASVEIRGNTPGQIREAATHVFEEHGYRVSVAARTNLVCEKPGGKMDQAAYGDWMGGEVIWTRIKVSVVPAGPDAFRLQCLAYKVRDRGSQAFEEEHKVANIGSHKYQKLLEEVAKRLRGPPEENAEKRKG